MHAHVAWWLRPARCSARRLTAVVGRSLASTPPGETLTLRGINDQQHALHQLVYQLVHLLPEAVLQLLQQLPLLLRGRLRVPCERRVARAIAGSWSTRRRWRDGVIELEQAPCTCATSGRLEPDGEAQQEPGGLELGLDILKCLPCSNTVHLHVDDGHLQIQ